MPKTRHRRITAALGLAWSMGCGGSDALQDEAAVEPAHQVEKTAPAERPPANRRPIIESVDFEPAEPVAGGALRAVVEARDPDGGELEMGYAWRVGGEPLDATGAAISLSSGSKGDTIEVLVTASDGRAVSRPFSASTHLANRSPVISGVWIEPADGVAGRGSITARVEARDPDGDPFSIRYMWTVNGRMLDENASVLEAALRRGDTVRLGAIVSDGQEESEVSTSAKITVANAPPLIVSTPARDESAPDGVFRYRVVADDVDGDHPLHIDLERAPEGMAMNPLNDTIEWRSNAGPGTYPVTISVEDPYGGRSTQGFELVIDPSG